MTAAASGWLFGGLPSGLFRATGNQVSLAKRSSHDGESSCRSVGGNVCGIFIVEIDA